MHNIVSNDDTAHPPDLYIYMSLLKLYFWFLLLSRRRVMDPALLRSAVVAAAFIFSQLQNPPKTSSLSAISCPGFDCPPCTLSCTCPEAKVPVIVCEGPSALLGALALLCVAVLAFVLGWTCHSPPPVVVGRPVVVAVGGGSPGDNGSEEAVRAAAASSANPDLSHGDLVALARSEVAALRTRKLVGR